MIDENIKMYRVFCGITVKQLASAAGIDTDTLIKIESGEIKPDKELIHKFSIIFNISEHMLCSDFDPHTMYNLNQNPWDELYHSRNHYEDERLLLNLLSDSERELVLKFRTCEDKKAFLDKCGIEQTPEE